MKRFVFCLAALGLLIMSGQAAAMPGPIAAAPAATLLLPNFEVDLDTYPNGVTTLFSVNNSDTSAQLAHVTVWSTWSIPLLDFDLYLTGYDVQTFNIGEILVAGNLPLTGPCNTSYPTPALSTSFRAHLQASLTGKPSPVTGTCAGRNYGDNVARGYVTVDTVNVCSLLFPSSPGYFISGGHGIASNANVLWGDYIYVDPGNNFAQGETLVHIKADDTILGTPGEYTFYGRYVGGTAADNREPLPTSFATRYVDGHPFGGGTRLVVWRDSKAPPGASCATGPNFGTLTEEQVQVFDEEENLLLDFNLSDFFPDETQRVSISYPASYGWLLLNLNHASAWDTALGPGYIGVAQAWVETVMESHGRFSVGYDAIQLDNANTPGYIPH